MFEAAMLMHACLVTSSYKPKKRLRQISSSQIIMVSAHGARNAHGAPNANSGAHVTHQTPLHADTPKDRPRPGNNKKNYDQMRRRPAASA